MKNYILFLLVSIPTLLAAQTKVEKTITAKAGQRLVVDFDDPSLKVQTWDQSNILVKGTVSINNGENDNAFEMQITNTEQEITIKSVLKDKENIPRHITIKKGDTEYNFKANDYNDPEVQKFLEQNGRDYTYMSNGIDIDIHLEIFVPRNMATRINAKFGLVEVVNFQAPLTVNSKFGGIDATIAARQTGELIARTQFGEILTNLDIKFDQNQPFESHDRWTVITAKPGAGPRYDFESKFGKLYLRKPAN